MESSVRIVITKQVEILDWPTGTLYYTTVEDTTIMHRVKSISHWDFKTSSVSNIRICNAAGWFPLPSTFNQIKEFILVAPTSYQIGQFWDFNVHPLSGTVTCIRGIVLVAFNILDCKLVQSWSKGKTSILRWLGRVFFFFTRFGSAALLSKYNYKSRFRPLFLGFFSSIFTSK